MKKIAKIIVLLIAVVAMPVIAGLGIEALWNGIVTSICGFAAITFRQSVGLFLLGQLLSGGFLVMLFVLLGCVHSICHHDGDWHGHWHKMTEEERREFILSRTRHVGFRNRSRNDEDAVE
ncbi:MAG: hypothetical protein K2L76_03990 [Muribaculaceae bacterium]|nr:hypothetical protein [Muribaculaceae bacterium]